ncbi:VWA domain-containing protein [Candidatus Poribacteria bacterium]|nr:VWA domain-containing protein [Candidatus Poribacteria bacterium]
MAPTEGLMTKTIISWLQVALIYYNLPDHNISRKSIRRCIKNAKGFASMKKLAKDQKLRNALLFSIIFHFVFIMVWGAVQIRLPKEEPESFVQIEILPTAQKPPLRMLKRPLLSPPSVPITERKSDQEIATHQPRVSHLVPPLVTSAARFNTSDLPPDPQGYRGGIGADTRLVSGHLQRPQGAGLMGMENRFTPSEIGGLTQPDIALVKIARNILSTRQKEAVDITFIIDGSQSMEDEIQGVRDRLSQMAGLLETDKLDFTIGVVIFRDGTAFSLLSWDFQVTPQTTSISKIKKVLDGIHCRGGEKALDALVRAADEVKFREGAERRFILVTDEFVSGSYSPKEVLTKMDLAGIHVDVIGGDERFQKLLAQHTGGIWLPISSLKE